jgi:hypothetical protein
MHYKTLQVRWIPEEWETVAIRDWDNGRLGALFTGPDAQARALAYATEMNKLEPTAQA